MLIETQIETRTESLGSNAGAPPQNQAIARFLPSLTDIAFLMPLMFIFIKLDGARTMLGDGDTGWHIRTGEWILDHGKVPTADMFSYTRPGAPWFAWEWLWDVLAAVLFRHWGMAAVVLGSILVVCLTSAFMFRLIRRSCDNGFVAIAVTLLATGGCAVHWLARPHLFTMLFMLVTLNITARAREGRTALLAWLAPLTLIWTNLHGGFFVVFLILACYIGADLFNAVIDQDRDRRVAYLAATKPWLKIFAVCFALTFVNPYGWNLHKHVLEYLTDPYQFKHIAEFQSVDFHAPVTVYFEPLMLLAICAACFDFSRRRFSDVLLSMGFLHLALVAQRNLPLFSIAASPLVARAITDFLKYVGTAPLNPIASRFTRWFDNFTESVEEIDRLPRVFLVSGLAALLVGTLLLITPAVPGVMNSKFISTYNPKSYPEKALTVLRSPNVHHIFAEDEWGDYLVYNLYPGKKVFIDGRSDFYGDKLGEQFLSVMNLRWDWQKTLDQYSVDTIVISPKFALSSALKISPDWSVVYDDHTSLIFRRRSGAQTPLATSSGGTQRDRAITQTNTGVSDLTRFRTTQPT
jgi:hypothetical protein